jgi:hypothetical protein
MYLYLNAYEHVNTRVPIPQAAGVCQPLSLFLPTDLVSPSNILLAGNNPNGNITLIPPGQPGFSSYVFCVGLSVLVILILYQ